MSDPSENREAAAERVQALRYLNSELSPGELQALHNQLKRDPDFAKRFVEFIQLAALIREQVQREEGVREELSLSNDKEVNFDELFAALMPPDDLPPIVLVTPTKCERDVQQEPLTRAQFVDVICYVLKQPSAMAYTVAGIAAALLIAGILSLFFLASTTPQTQDIAGQTPANDETQAANFVATLTAARNAKWRAGYETVLPRLDDGLRAGDRLTLVAGVAEITTVRGAVAILEAPCTIELIDSPNALRLVSGKLVGICETESSKGFLVRTPHMDVTDLGTRFGIDASAPDRATLHVFDGEVEAASSGAVAGTVPQRFSAGQAAAASKHDTSISVISYEPQQFSEMIDRIYEPADYVLAYWRFEEGAPGSNTPDTDAANEDFSKHAATDQSGNGNLLYAFSAKISPSYTDVVPASLIPQTGQLNRGAIDDGAMAPDTPINLFTRASASRPKSAVEGAKLDQWTVEASVKPSAIDGKQAFVSMYKRGLKVGNVLTLGLEAGRLFIEVDDGSGQPRRVTGPQPIDAAAWTHVAATCDGKTLSLYAKANRDAAYTLLGQTTVQRALVSRGDTPATQWAWSIGGALDGMDARALIDEVRISGKTLATHELLFSQPNP